MLERNFGEFSVNLSWQFFDPLIGFKMVAFINFEAVQLVVISPHRGGGSRLNFG